MVPQPLMCCCLYQEFCGPENSLQGHPSQPAWKDKEGLAVVNVGHIGGRDEFCTVSLIRLAHSPWQVYNPRIRTESQELRPISQKQAEARRLRAAGNPPGEAPVGPGCSCLGHKPREALACLRASRELEPESLASP